MHDPARRVVNEGEQGALRPTALEPPMLRTVDLDQLPQTLAPIARLVHPRQTLLAILPDPIRQHPPADGLDAKPQPMTLGKLLGRERGAEIRVVRTVVREELRSP